MKKPNILAMKPALHLGCALLFALAWQGCKDKPDPEPEVLVQDGILVLNEGNYLSGNASLSFEDAEGTVTPDVYKSASQLPLGDVAQSMALAEGDVFVVVNNSGKLLRLDLPSLDQVCAANGLLSPRHFQSISPTKAYISDLYSRTITILNPSTCTVTGQIATGGWTEEMLVLGSKCYVAQTGTDKLLVINTTTDQLIDSIAIGRGPVSLVQRSIPVPYYLKINLLPHSHSTLTL
jgi:YVTN family beta-propeller protein